MEYLEVHIKIPTELENSIKNEIYEKIMSLPCERFRETIFDDSIIYNFKTNINFALHIEELFDIYINLKVQYEYLLYESEKKYPSSTRINRKGKKIFKKNQTKITCF